MHSHHPPRAPGLTQPPTSLPADPSSTMVRQETAGLGRMNNVGLHSNYSCQYNCSLPWIASINEEQIQSVQVFCASQRVKEEIKVDGSCTGSNKPKCSQLIPEPSMTLPEPDSSTTPHPHTYQQN